jgi:hypothetical protein
MHYLSAGCWPVRMELQFNPDPVSSQSTLTYNTYQLLYIYSKYLLMMGDKNARNM